MRNFGRTLFPRVGEAKGKLELEREFVEDVIDVRHISQVALQS